MKFEDVLHHMDDMVALHMPRFVRIAATRSEGMDDFFGAVVCVRAYFVCDKDIK
jgi:hypothetical protein